MDDARSLPTSMPVTSRRATRQAAGVWAMTVGIAGAAAAVNLLLRNRGPDAPALEGMVGFVVLAALFAAAEALVIHLNLGRSAHTLSVAEAVVVVALLQSSPSVAVLAHVVGSGATLLAFRHQELRKVAFNLAAFALELQLAAVLVLVVFGTSEIRSPVDWIAIYAGVGTYAVVGALLVATVISVVDRRPALRTMLAALRMGLGTAVVTTSIGIVSAVLLDHAPSAALLMLIPVFGAYVSSQVLLRERRRRDELEFLHRSAEDIRGTDGTVRMMRSLVDRAVADLGLAHLEVEFLDGERFERVSAGEHVGTSEAELPSVLEHAPPSAVLLVDGGVVAQHHRPLMDALEARDLRTAIVAPIRTADDTVGTIVVGDRLSSVATLDREDVVLVETLAGQLATVLERGRLERSVSDLQQMERRLVHELQHDALTGLFNRTAFVRRLKHDLGSADGVARQHRLAVVLIDLDDFKLVNDVHGHAAGDDYLVAVAERVTGHLRIGDAAARFGGDEFAVVLEGTDAVSAEQRAKELVEVLRAPVLLAGHGPVGGGASVGVGLDHPDDTVESILDRADLAMYQAKRRGKGTFHVVDPTTDLRERQLRELGSQFREAFAAGEMDLAFQGVHDLATGSPVGVECLVRWRHATFGVLEPGVFLGLSLEPDMSRQLRSFTIPAACEAIASTAQLGGEFPVSVNLSGPEIADPGLLETIVDALEQTGADRVRLWLEVQHQTLSRSPTAVLGHLDKLRAFGLGLVLDDVQIEAVPFDLLVRVSPRQVKLSRSAVAAAATTAGRHAVRSLAVLGEEVGFRLVAKGVEDRGTADGLARLGITMAQGHLFSRPSALRVLAEASGLERRSSRVDRRTSRAL